MKQVIYGMAEVVATHNLVRYLRQNTTHERMRMVAGGSMVMLGYALGPELEERLQSAAKGEFSAAAKQQALYTCGGVILGGVAGFLFGKNRYEQQHDPTVALDEKISKSLETAQPNAPAFDAQRPGGLLTLASAGWLGYSLLFDGKTPQEQHRHLWALGAGVVGYSYGPEAIQKIKDLVIPSNAAQQGMEAYARGSAALGAIIGGAGGWYLSNTKKSSIVRME